MSTETPPPQAAEHMCVQPHVTGTRVLLRTDVGHGAVWRQGHRDTLAHAKHAWEQEPHIHVGSGTWESAAIPGQGIRDKGGCQDHGWRSTCCKPHAPDVHDHSWTRTSSTCSLHSTQAHACTHPHSNTHVPAAQTHTPLKQALPKGTHTLHTHGCTPAAPHTQKSQISASSVKKTNKKGIYFSA